MKKNQVPESAPSFLPISAEVLKNDFQLLQSYTSDDLTTLKEWWLLDNLHDNPSHKLLTLEARPEIGLVDSIRRAYRAGIIGGTSIVRDQLITMNENPSILTMRRGEKMPIDWTRMKLARFTLSSLFESTPGTHIDVSAELREQVEQSWQSHGNTFQPDKDQAQLINNDWLSVGMGDAIVLNATVYAMLRHEGRRLFAIEPLAPEPLLENTH